MDIIQYVHPFATDRHLGCFWLEIIPNKAVLNIRMQEFDTSQVNAPSKSRMAGLQGIDNV